MKNKKVIIALIAIILSIVCLYTSQIILGIIFLLVGLAYIYLSMRVIRGEKNSVISDLTEEVLKEIFEVKEYNRNGVIDRKHIDNSRLFPIWSDNGNNISIDESYYVDGSEYHRGSDHIKGKYKGIDFEFSDMELFKQKVTKDDEGKETTTTENLLKGQWTVLSLNRSVEHKVQVKKKETRLMGGYKKGKNSIETENMDFNKKFEVYGDSHTAFYILTPHFMEYIIAADDKFPGRTYLGFEGDKVHIVRDTGKNLFKVKGDAKNREKVKERIESECKFITDVLDEIMRNEYLFDKAAKIEK